jgi:hypothetical protein
MISADAIAEWLIMAMGALVCLLVGLMVLGYVTFLFATKGDR